MPVNRHAERCEVASKTLKSFEMLNPTLAVHSVTILFGLFHRSSDSIFTVEFQHPAGLAVLHGLCS